MSQRCPTCGQVIGVGSDELLAPRHAAELLGLGDDRVRALVRSGELPAMRLPDGRIVIRRADVEELEERRAKSGPP